VSSVLCEDNAGADAGGDLQGKWRLVFSGSGSLWSGPPCGPESTLTVDQQTIVVKWVDPYSDSRTEARYDYELVPDKDPTWINITSFIDKRERKDNLKNGVGVFAIERDLLTIRLAFSRGDDVPPRPATVRDETRSRGSFVQFLIVAERPGAAARPSRMGKPGKQRPLGEWVLVRREQKGRMVWPPREGWDKGTTEKWIFLDNMLLVESIHPLAGVHQLKWYVQEFNTWQSPAWFDIWEPGDGNMDKAQLAVRVAATLGLIDSRLKKLENGLLETQGNFQGLETRALRWILVATVGITLLAIWMAGGQAALCLLAWTGLRRTRQGQV
jgi:uncharacterized protein (TIGR03067 family)